MYEDSKKQHAVLGKKVLQTHDHKVLMDKKKELWELFPESITFEDSQGSFDNLLSKYFLSKPESVSLITMYLW